MLNILPAPTYSHIWGHQKLRENLIKSVAAADSPWITTITGIGGIGKTVLADQVVRAAYSQGIFHRLMWIQVTSFSLSGQQEATAVWRQVQSGLLAQTNGLADSSLSDERQFRYLQQQFKSQPCLVVIDNIEDLAIVPYLLERLSHWADPSHFILTSRIRPQEQTGLTIYTVNELSQADSLALLRHEAARLNLVEVAQAEDHDLLPIYAITGGNPLALKLATGLATVMPLPVIMQNLTETPTGPAETMYQRIYRAAWQSLSDEARTLLEIMPLVSEVGARPEQMKAISELEDGPFWMAVRELVTRSLLEVRGDAWERRYGIHRLTQTFLQTEIIS